MSVAIGSRGESNRDTVNKKAERGNYFWVPWLLMSGTMPMAVPRPSVVFCIYRRSGLPVFCQYICSKGTNERLLYYMRKDLSVELFLHVCSTIDKRGQRGLYRWERWMGWGWAGGESQGPYSSAFSVLDKRAYVSVVSFRTYQLPEYWIDVTLIFSPNCQYSLILFRQTLLWVVVTHWVVTGCFILLLHIGSQKGAPMGR